MRKNRRFQILCGMQIVAFSFLSLPLSATQGRVEANHMKRQVSNTTADPEVVQMIQDLYDSQEKTEAKVTTQHQMLLGFGIFYLIAFVAGGISIPIIKCTNLCK